MGSYKYHSNPVKPCVGIVEWSQKIADFWISNHVTTVSHFFFNELLRNGILGYSTSFAIIVTAPSPLWDLGIRVLCNVISRHSPDHIISAGNLMTVEQGHNDTLAPVAIINLILN